MLSQCDLDVPPTECVLCEGVFPPPLNLGETLQLCEPMKHRGGEAAKAHGQVPGTSHLLLGHSLLEPSYHGLRQAK